MRANRITFSNIKQQWELLKMKAAYIDAERTIMQEANRGNHITGFQDQQVSFEVDGFEFNANTTDESFSWIFGDGNKMGNLNELDRIYKDAQNVRNKLDQAIDEENYVKAEMLQNVLNGLEKQYNKLKNQ